LILAFPDGSPRARFLRRWRWHAKEWSQELKTWLAYATQLDRSQRAAFHGAVRGLLDRARPKQPLR
jgi:hypothetical protein